MKAAMLEAGYSENTAVNPQKVFKKQAFTEILDKAGLTDDFLAQGHRELAQASEIRTLEFAHRRVPVISDVDPEAEPEDGEDPGAVAAKRLDTRLEPWSDEKIIAIIKRQRGAEFLYIADYYDKRVAYYTAPLYLSRSKAYDLGYKVRGHFAAERHEHEVKHELSGEEKANLDSLFNKKHETDEGDME